MSLSRTFARRPDFWAVLALLLIAIVMMLPYLLQPTAIMWPRSNLGTDLTTYRWPSVYYVRQMLGEHGYLPLWQTNVMGGLPLLGNPGMRVYYPPQLLLTFLPVPIPLLFAVLNTLHFWLAGVGSYGLARSMLRVNRGAAFIAALLVILTPRLSSNITGDLSHTHGLTMVPLCFLLVWLTLERRSWRWAIAAGVGLFMLYLLNLQFTLYLAWFTGVWFLYSSVWDYRQREAQTVRAFMRGWLRRVALLIVMGLVALGLAAFQLLPFLTYLPYQIRDAMTLENANYLALPIPLLMNAIAPTAQKFPEWELYVGLLALVLAPLAFAHTKRRETYFWAGVLIFAVLFSLGSTTPVYPFMVQVVPGFRFLRVAPRMWYFVALAAAMLTALTVDWLLNGGKLGRAAWRWLILSSGILMIATVIIRFMTRRPEEPDWLMGFFACLGLLAALIGLRQWQRGRLSGAQLAGVLALAVAVDLAPVAFAFHVPRPAEEIFATPDIVTALPAAEDELYRVYGIRRELPDHIVVLNDLEVVDGLNSFQFATYSNFMRTASGCDLEGIAAAVPPCASNEIDPEAYLRAVPNPALLGLLNVRYIIASYDLAPQPALALVAETEAHRLYENNAALPRAFAVGRAQVVENEAEALAALRQLEPQQSAIVERDQINFAVPENDFYVPAEVSHYTPDDITLNITMPDAGILVLGDPWVVGWQAEVDGEQRPVLRVNGALRGLHLEAGDHAVRFYFMPPAFVTGLALAIITALLCAAALVIGRWRSVHE